VAHAINVIDTAPVYGFGRSEEIVGKAVAEGRLRSRVLIAKTAGLALSRGLAKRMAGTGVTVNAILPGPTLSEGVREMLRPEQQKTGKPIEDVAAEFVKRHRPSSIIQRAATVEEVANLVVYVASPLFSATTGTALRVDGGVVESIA
jgi:NAD(P)-dependent dehydrogenase (short-subunit alcohol dehydrogenase family)